MPAHRERSSSVNYGGPALVTNGDYLTIRANPLENNLAQWPDFSRSTSREALAAPLSTSREMPIIRLIHSFDTQW
jgi:hypothetical protein